MHRFIVGTGRCGSTLLSSLLEKHPDVLSLSEMLVGLSSLRRFERTPVSGSDLADNILPGREELANLWLSRGYTVAEASVDESTTDQPEPRFQRSMLLSSAMTYLKPDDPASIYAEILDWARVQPSRPMGQHLLALFDWLAELFGKKFWIERSGGSIDFLKDLRELFPDARFLHLHRDGREVALSMRQHAHFVQLASFYDDPPNRAELEQAVNAPSRSPSDPIVRRMESDIPVERYGEFWSRSIAVGFREFAHIPPSEQRHLRFEDLFHEPRETLKAITEYFEIPFSADWADGCVGRLRPKLPVRIQELSGHERRALDRACAPGQILLGRDEGIAPGLEAAQLLASIYREREFVTSG